MSTCPGVLFNLFAICGYYFGLELGSLYINEMLNFNRKKFVREPFRQLDHALSSFPKNQVESKPAKQCK
jgi:hypothetical protein